MRRSKGNREGREKEQGWKERRNTLVWESGNGFHLQPAIINSMTQGKTHSIVVWVGNNLKLKPNEF